MIVEIVSVGDELIEGIIANTNATFLSHKLLEIGIRVRWITAVGDDVSTLTKVLHLALTRAQVVICTGGLGPTHDDVTKKAICELFDLKLVLHSATLEKIKARFARRGVAMVKVNENQALIPEGLMIIENQLGTAPGMFWQQNDRMMFFLPGVPFEMQQMSTNFVIPWLVNKNPGHQGRSLTIRTTGVPESTLYQEIGDIGALEKDARVAFNPHFAGVDIRLTTLGASESECMEKLNRVSDIIHGKIGYAIYGHNGDTLEKAILDILTAQKKTLAVAESCTGGLIANRFTNIPGSSDCFMRALVTYSNQSKIELLQIPESVLQAHGAVSQPVAQLMAENVRKLAGVDYGIATTGIAGPGGGSQKKPVGLVFVAYSDTRQTVAERFVFNLDRIGNKERFAQAALNLFYKSLTVKM